MSQYYYPSFRKTYELETQPNNQADMTFNSSSNLYPKINSERLSTSPPIILCETGNSRNKNNHSHRYLFYPSTSRLSPFSDNMNNDYNIIKRPYLNINNYNSKNEIRNRFRDENPLNNIDNNENFKNDKDLEGRVNYNNNLGRKLIDSPQNIDKYQTMFDKSLELMKEISNFIPEEDAKIKGNSSYYFNRDRDYDTIIEKQKNFLQKYFKNKQGNQNQIETNIYNNNNNNNINLKSRNDGQFKNNFENINDNKEINFGNDLYNENNNKNNNLENLLGNNMNNNKDFTNNNNIRINSRNAFENENNENNLNDNDNNIRINSRNTFDNESNQNNFNFDKSNPNNQFYNKTTNQPNFEGGLGNMNNIIGKRGTSTYPNNIMNNFYDNIKGNDNNNKYNRNYINDYNNIYSENNMKNGELKPKTLLQMEGDNNKYDKNGFQSSSFNNPNNILSNSDNININNLDDNQNMKNNLNILNSENNNAKVLDNNSNKGNSYFNSGMSNLPTRDYFNTNNIQKRSPNQTTTNYNQPLSQTDNNIDKKLQEQNSNPNFNFQSNPNNYPNNYYDNNLPSSNNIDNNYNTNNNNINNNNIDNDNRIRSNKINPEKIEEIKESESFGELLDENNKKILSEDGKPFQREIVNEKYDKDNKTFVVTKSGANLKLSILHNREGLPLTHNGYPLLGKGEKYYIDRSGKPIVYPDDNYMEGEEKIPVKIKALNRNELDDLNNGINNINLNNENDIFQFNNTLASKYSMNDNNPNNYYNIGFGGGLSTTQLKKSRMVRGKNRHFPKGAGDAKPPIFKKRRKKRILKK